MFDAQSCDGRKFSGSCDKFIPLYVSRHSASGISFNFAFMSQEAFSLVTVLSRPQPLRIQILKNPAHESFAIVIYVISSSVSRPNEADEV